MLRFLSVTLSVLVLGAAPCFAQTPFGNPFASAQAYRDTRGPAADAATQYSYEVTQVRTDGAKPFPSHWTDIGDRFTKDYNFSAAFHFYDVAFSLPMPSANANNRALMGKRTYVEGLRREAANFFPRN